MVSGWIPGCRVQGLESRLLTLQVLTELQTGPIDQGFEKAQNCSCCLWPGLQQGKTVAHGIKPGRLGIWGSKDQGLSLGAELRDTHVSLHRCRNVVTQSGCRGWVSVGGSEQTFLTQLLGHRKDLDAPFWKHRSVQESHISARSQTLLIHCARLSSQEMSWDQSLGYSLS